MEKIGDAIHAGVDKVKETFSGASKEANKEVAKDSSQSASTRIQAAANAASKSFWFWKKKQIFMSTVLI